MSLVWMCGQPNPALTHERGPAHPPTRVWRDGRWVPVEEDFTGELVHLEVESTPDEQPPGQVVGGPVLMFADEASLVAWIFAVIALLPDSTRWAITGQEAGQ